ncbi:MAG: M48 family metallopeptidase [Pseudomonadales bacterium]|nr:M48 family metallopeptidase [Pseudomonadales bacterium]
MRPRLNPKIPEGINTSQENLLVEVIMLLLAVVSSIVALIVLLSFIAQIIAPRTPFRWEQSITQWIEVMPKSKDTENNSAAANAEQALNSLSERLSKSMKLPADISLKVHLLESGTPNAFATLGGHIFVSTGLLKTLHSENALAMVLAHEIAHIKFRHPIQALGRGALFQFLLQLVTGSGNSGTLYNIFGHTGFLTLLSFGRDMERESDAEAVLILLKHYGHLNGADEFFVTMRQNQHKDAWKSFFETHPGTEDRIAYIRAKISATSATHNSLQALDSALDLVESALD